MPVRKIFSLRTWILCQSVPDHSGAYFKFYASYGNLLASSAKHFQNSSPSGMAVADHYFLRRQPVDWKIYFISDPKFPAPDPSVSHGKQGIKKSIGSQLLAAAEFFPAVNIASQSIFSYNSNK